MNWFKLHIILYVALIVTVLPSCIFGDGFGQRREKASDPINKDGKELEENGEERYFVGEICLVQESLGFVLIKSAKVKPSKGTILHVMRDGGIQEISKLSVSPERRPGFVVADIIAGEPNAGDWVFFKLRPNEEVEEGPEELRTEGVEFGTLPLEVKQSVDNILND